MIFTYLRSCYDVVARWQNGGDDTILIRWRKAKPGALRFPFHHAYEPLVWQGDWQDEFAGPGETTRQRRWTPTRESSFPGNHFEGEPEWFASGVPPNHWNDPPAICPLPKPSGSGTLELWALGLQVPPRVVSISAFVELWAEGQLAPPLGGSQSAFVELWAEGQLAPPLGGSQSAFLELWAEGQLAPPLGGSQSAFIELWAEGHATSMIPQTSSWIELWATGEQVSSDHSVSCCPNALPSRLTGFVGSAACTCINGTPDFTYSDHCLSPVGDVGPGWIASTIGTNCDGMGGSVTFTCFFATDCSSRAWINDSVYGLTEIFSSVGLIDCGPPFHASIGNLFGANVANCSSALGGTVTVTLDA